MTTFEQGTRVQFLLHVPWLESSHGKRSSQLVEMIDLLPTLVELAGLSLPTNQTYDGVSLVCVLDHSCTRTGKNSSFSQYPRLPKVLTANGTVNTSLLWADNRAGSAPRSEFYAMGHSVRTDTFRYTEWVLWDAARDQPNWGLPLAGQELYLHAHDKIRDFDSYENQNLAKNKDYAAVVVELSGFLRYFFQTAECTSTLCSANESARARAAQGIPGY